MIAKHGESVWGQPKAGALKELGSQISDRDQNVRSAALNALVEVHRLIGDKERVKNRIKSVFMYSGNYNESRRKNIIHGFINDF